jgi:hypothetical protein
MDFMYHLRDGVLYAVTRGIDINGKKICRVDEMMERRRCTIYQDCRDEYRIIVTKKGEQYDGTNALDEEDVCVEYDIRVPSGPGEGGYWIGIAIDVPGLEVGFEFARSLLQSGWSAEDLLKVKRIATSDDVAEHRDAIIRELKEGE